MTGLELLLENRAGRRTLRSASGLRRRKPTHQNIPAPLIELVELAAQPTSDSGKATQEIVLVEVVPEAAEAEADADAEEAAERKSPLRLLAMGLGVVGLVGVAYYYLVPDKKTFP